MISRDQTRRRRESLRAHLHPTRMLLYAAVTLAAVMAGYGVGMLLRGDAEAPPAPGEAPADAPMPERGANGGADGAWYRRQEPPPELVRAPDAPIFPDGDVATGGQPVRAYEEALPTGIYVPSPPRPSEPAGESATGTPTAPSRDAVPETGSAEPPQALAEAGPADAETPPWRRFAAAAPPADGEAPLVAVVIDDMGMDRKRSARAVALPAPLTLSYLTYAGDLSGQTTAARAAGHELLAHVAMEPRNDALDPGPDVLLTRHGAETLRRRLARGLGRFEAIVGINNHMGSAFTADAAGMAIVMAELKARGLLFLDSRTSGATVGAELARRFGVPTAERNIFLDNVNEVPAVEARLAELEALARRKGAAVAIGHPRDATLEALAGWLPGLRERGLRLVPVSAIVRRGQGRAAAALTLQ